jgi:hypothetical protein
LGVLALCVVFPHLVNIMREGGLRKIPWAPEEEIGLSEALALERMRGQAVNDLADNLVVVVGVNPTLVSPRAIRHKD